jgi:hypothetical protein
MSCVTAIVPMAGSSPAFSQQTVLERRKFGLGFFFLCFFCLLNQFSIFF